MLSSSCARVAERAPSLASLGRSPRGRSGAPRSASLPPPLSCRWRAEGLTWMPQCPDRPAGTVDVCSRRCECGGSKATYGFPDAPMGQRSPRWCPRCPNRPIETVSLAHRWCACGQTKPTYGPNDGNHGCKFAVWCSKCPDKPDDAVNKVGKRCECGKSLVSFGLPGGVRKAAQWCGKCPTKPDNAVNVANRRCECGRVQPTFGPPDVPRGSRFARWCANCPTKPADAINVIGKKCECGETKAFWSLPAIYADPRWCKDCPPPEGALDTKTGICFCGKGLAVFGLRGGTPGKTTRWWCPECPNKPAEALDMRRFICECKQAVPNYGIPCDQP
mmetsp:Transcript_40796/g.130219  ORF Transcript_40796/g.130219 Transcript_40796/m.130219 type:complete len:332 (-) Transcript_40796:39-1034(-)